MPWPAPVAEIEPMRLDMKASVPRAGPSSGVINFVLESGRVRFEIDASLAEQNGIAISSRVLELAVRVKKAAVGGTESVPS